MRSALLPAGFALLLTSCTPRAPSDRDGDGVADDLDAFPDDPTETTDTDGDGVGDNADECPEYDDDACVNGSCSTGVCVCDSGWGGPMCDIELLRITGIAPRSGYYLGGRTIAVEGAAIDDATRVAGGGADCTDIQVIDASSLTCVVPPGPVGPADVVATRGTEEATLPGAFDYLDFAAVTAIAGTGDDAAAMGRVDGAGDLATFSGALNSLLLVRDTLYVADGGSYAIRAIDLAGLDPASPAPTQFGDCRIRQIDTTTGAVTTLAGDGSCLIADGPVGGGGGVGSVQGLAYHPDHGLFFTETDWGWESSAATSFQVRLLH